MTDLEKNFTNKESEFLTWAEPGGSNYSPAVDDKLSRQVQLHFTASIDLTLFTTDREVLHKRGRGETPEGREFSLSGCCGQLIQARAVIMIRVSSVTSEFPWWRAGGETVTQLAPPDPGHLTHPTDICQQRSPPATVRPQFVRLIT